MMRISLLICAMVLSGCAEAWGLHDLNVTKANADKFVACVNSHPISPGMDVLDATKTCLGTPTSMHNTKLANGATFTQLIWYHKGSTMNPDLHHLQQYDLADPYYAYFTNGAMTAEQR